MEAKTHYAICIMNPDGDSGVSGLVKFVQVEGQHTIVNAHIKGLKAGKHGFHVHEFGNLTEGCKSAGAHWNPEKRDHGGPDDHDRHHGDMGNVTADGVNETVYVYADRLIQLHGAHSIIGRACVVHADEDDLGKGGQSDSKTTGHAGARLACGVIGLSSQFDFQKPN